MILLLYVGLPVLWFVGWVLWAAFSAAQDELGFGMVTGLFWPILLPLCGVVLLVKTLSHLFPELD